MITCTKYFDTNSQLFLYKFIHFDEIPQNNDNSEIIF